MTEIKYTVEEGGEWISARTDEENFVQSLQTWAESAERKIDPERRIPLETEGGNVVPAAAIRLPNGRVIDAILGCFRDDEEALEQLRKNTEPKTPSATMRAALRASKEIQDYLDGEGPDPLPTDETDGA